MAEMKGKGKGSDGSAGSLLNDGLNMKEKISDIKTIGKETNEAEQRPVLTPTTISSDRGTFTSK